MIEFLTKYLWWIGWIVLTPFVLFCAIVYYILTTFEQYKLNDWDWDEDELESVQ